MISTRSRAGTMVTAILAVALAAVWALTLGGGGEPSLAALGAIAALALFANVAPIRFQHGREVEHLTVDEAILIVGLSLEPRLAILALAVGTLISQLIRRRPLIKLGYNVGAVTLSGAAATFVYLPLAQGVEVGTAAWAGAALAAAVTHGVTSLLLISVLLKVLEGTPLRSSLKASAVLNTAIWTANWAIGVLLSLAALVTVAWLILGGVALAGLHLGYRGYVSVRQERESVEQLRELSRTLGGAAVDPDAFPRALELVMEQFSARGGVLRLHADAAEGLDHHRGELPSPEMQAVLARAEATGESLRFGRGDLSLGLVSPIVNAGRSIGIVAVHDRVGVEPWTSTDAAMLDAIASEIGVAVTNRHLLASVERARLHAQEESEKLSDVLEAATDGIAVVSADGIVTSWNLGMTSITGVHPADAIGRPWWSVLRLKDRDDRELLPDGDHVFTEALAGERTREPVPLQALRRDGQWRWSRVSFAPLVHDGRHVEGTVLVARDVTAEHELAALKADFIATVSHELRTPLTPLKGFVATLLQRHDELDDGQRKLLFSSMEGQVNRLEQLVADLLLVADLDRGGLTLESGSVPLRDAIAVAVHAESPADQARIAVSPGVGGSVIGDRKAIVRILRSLVSNAVKHTAGAIHVDAGSNASHRWITVSDTGPGIPPWEHEKVFERFHRLGDHLLRTQGPGLGLPIAKALAEELGGTLSVRSDVGAGACFTLTLPAAEDVETVSPQPEPRHA